MGSSTDYVNHAEVNYDDLSDDAAATEFECSYGNLVASGGTPDDVTFTVDEILDTLNGCVTKVSTLDDMVTFVFESMMGGQYMQYIAANFLAELCSKFTREIEGKTFALTVKDKLREIIEKAQKVLRDLASRGDMDPKLLKETRCAILFFAELSQKLLRLPECKLFRPAMIFSVSVTVDLLLDTQTPFRSEYLANATCALQILKMVGPTVDEIIRTEPSVTQELKRHAEISGFGLDETVHEFPVAKAGYDGLASAAYCFPRFPGVIPKIYDKIREILISSNDLSPHVRADILKVLENRASRWGEVPLPDKPLEPPSSGTDEVDPVWYGPDREPLSKEEADFFNEAAEELDISDEEDAHAEMEPYVDELEGEYNDPPEPEVNGLPQFVWKPEEVPDEIMQEFRRRQKPGYKPDGAGDRLPE